MSRPAERIVAFYDKRGTCEQWIKEGIPAHFGDAGADQGLVTDESEGEAHQDRREGRQPWALCRVPDGRGRHSAKSVRRHPADDRGTAVAAGHIDSVKRSFVTHRSQTHGRGAPQ